MQTGRDRGLNKPEALSEHQARRREWGQSADTIRFYEGERRPGIDYPWSIALTEENQDDTT